MKVLYVCPFAHDLASYSYMSIYETKALHEAKVDVELLTYKGLLDKTNAGIRQYTVYKYTNILLRLLYYLAGLLRKSRYTRMLAKMLEYYLTLKVAIKLNREHNYDIIHLREGDPFLFILYLLNLRLRDFNWAVVLIGAELTVNNSILTKIMNSTLCKVIANKSSKYNNFVYLTENRAIENCFRPYISKGIYYLPLGISEVERVISKTEARKHLEISMVKTVLLCFGSPHTGKDWEVIYHTLHNVPDVILLQAGNQRLDDRGLNLQLPNTIELSKKYNIQDRVIIDNKYISEKEKPYYFFAADAIILSYTKEFISNASMLWEACRFQLPVICSDNEQLKQTIIKYNLGLYFWAQDSSSLRESIMYFTTLEQEEITAFKDGCRKFSKDHSSKQWAKQCLLIYSYIKDNGR
ncbi:MAG: hypothetical protein PHQ22_10880 [Sulfuricurvum sp.]|nr:hypothetical protein [Sulfuricurvum sp.]